VVQAHSTQATTMATTRGRLRTSGGAPPAGRYAESWPPRCMVGGEGACPSGSISPSTLRKSRVQPRSSTHGPHAAWCWRGPPRVAKRTSLVMVVQRWRTCSMSRQPTPMIAASGESRSRKLPPHGRPSSSLPLGATFSSCLSLLPWRPPWPPWPSSPHPPPAPP